MITKERLEELIQQEATIYNVSSMKYVGERKLNNLVWIDENNLCFDKSDYPEIAFLDKLFETKEEAEWYLEFGNITRVEKLTLPTWEYWQKVSKYGMYAMSFFDKENHYCELQILETIKVVKWGYGRTVEFENSATKENYTEACRLCKKLFLGENK